MDENQLAEATAGTVERRDFVIREVSNGFVMNGNRRFTVPGTEQVKLALAFEGVATTAADVIDAVTSFINTGKIA